MLVVLSLYLIVFQDILADCEIDWEGEGTVRGYISILPKVLFPQPSPTERLVHAKEGPWPYSVRNFIATSLLPALFPRAPPFVLTTFPMPRFLQGEVVGLPLCSCNNTTCKWRKGGRIDPFTDPVIQIFYGLKCISVWAKLQNQPLNVLHFSSFLLINMRITRSLFTLFKGILFIKSHI